MLKNTGEEKLYQVAYHIVFDLIRLMMLNFFFFVSTECVSSHRYFKTFLSVFLLTLVLGLGILAVVRLLLRGKNWSLRGHVIEQFDDSSKVCACEWDRTGWGNMGKDGDKDKHSEDFYIS